MMTLVVPMGAAEPSAASLYRKGRKAEKKGDFPRAYLLYSQAFARNPKNDLYWAASQGVRGLAISGLNVVSAAGNPEEPAKDTAPEAPALESASESDQMLAARALPPPKLKPSALVRDFDLKGDSRELFEQVAKAFGLDTVFDGDYQPAANVRFRITGADFRLAMRALEDETDSFIVPISERLMLVAKDTPQKRIDVEPVMSVTVPFPEPLSLQDVQEAVNGLKQLFEMQRVGVDGAHRQVVFRDRVSRLRPALALFHQLMTQRAQVVVEVDLLAISENSSKRYGFKLPSMFTLSWLSQFGAFHPTPLPEGISGLLVFGGGMTMMGLGITDAAFFATMTHSTASTMVHAEMRSLDTQTASMHVGDKYPVITLGYYGSTPATGTVYTPPPNITFEDLGVVLKVTPKVHDSEEVSLDIEAEYRVLSGDSLNGIPIISDRKFASRVRMKFSEAAVLGGLINDRFSHTWNGIPGLLHVPLLHEKNEDLSKSDILLVLRPRLVNLPPSETMAPREIWSGTETRPLSATEP
jgi:general secretion pathway protein D